MPTQLPTPVDGMGTGTGIATVSYGYRPSLVGPPCQFELTEQGLSWRVARRSGLWPYASIAAIRLSYRPTSMQSRRFRADIRNDSGQSIPVVSASWQTVALMASQDEPYRAFVTELHRRIAAAGGRPELLGGLRRPIYGLGVAAMVFVGVSLLGLLIRAAMVGSYAGMLFLVGFAALFGWQVGGFMRRNKPRRYAIDAVPRELIP